MFAQMIAFVWCSCERKPEYLEKTHLSDLVTTWSSHMRRQVSNLGCRGKRQALYHWASQTAYYIIC